MKLTTLKGALVIIIRRVMKLNILNGSCGNYKQTRHEADRPNGNFGNYKTQEA